MDNAVGNCELAALAVAAENELKKLSVSVLPASAAVTSSVKGVMSVVPGPETKECKTCPVEVWTLKTHGKTRPEVLTDHAPLADVVVDVSPDTHFNETSAFATGAPVAATPLMVAGAILPDPPPDPPPHPANNDVTAIGIKTAEIFFFIFFSTVALTKHVGHRDRLARSKPPDRHGAHAGSFFFFSGNSSHIAVN
ncbi:hypothetical protein [Paraburkholderia unamae]|uniref:hypothetical protein n=1 Tax=Paraburkholderia unamae TaxID=219649 RepID=UPI001C65FEDB|nr:hypothetical protein [Paraburkholderia unamae]